MNILLIQRDGVDLHHTLFASETSRPVLRFYHPKKKSATSEKCSSKSPRVYSALTCLHRTCITSGHPFLDRHGHSVASTGSAGER
jgi:hypothetical protein